MDIIPTEGYVAVEFLELDSDEEDEQKAAAQYESYPAPSGSSYNDACFAQCIGVGKKVTACKRGDTVLVRKYARENGIKISDDVVLCEAYLVVGVVKNK